MSAIGDQVHLTAKNYLEYGLNQRESQKKQRTESIANNIFRQQKERIYKKVLEKKKREQLTDLKTLEETLNGMFGESEEAFSQILSQVRQIIEKQLEKQQKDSLGRIDWNTGNVNKENLLEGVTEISKIQKTEKQESMKFSTIYKRIEKIEIYLKELGNKGLNQGTTYEKLTKQLGLIKTDFNNLLKEFKSEKLPLSSEMEGSFTFSEDKKEYGNKLIDSLNKIIAGSGAGLGIQKGDLFEDLIALAPVMAGQKGMEEADKLLKDVVGTTGKSSTIIKSGLFSPFVNLNFLSETTSGKKGTYEKKEQVNETLYVSKLMSQDKIDINLTWSGKLIPVSAKNINFQSGYNIHLVSKASFLSMIQDENSNFVNHYLNVFAYHSDEGISIQLKNQATLAMKVTLLLKAFEGYKDTGKAELFIVNDNTSGKIRVFSIANLISKIYKDIENYSNIILSGGSDISNLSLKNSRQATYSDRITKLIQDVHNHKITVSIPPSVLMEETSTLTE